MSAPKRGPGRPPTDPAGRMQKYRVRLTPTARAAVERLARRWGCGLDRAIRRAITETAEREGVSERP